MEYSRKASLLLVRLRREMNGAVVGDMESRGIRYPTNYGVSLNAIRSAAREFAPDHGFAKYLWQRPVRELRLAAAAIADPEAITAEELAFWLEGAENTELAENIASFLLSRSGHVRLILETYSRSENPFTAYAALLSAVRGYPQGLTAASVMEITNGLAADTPFVGRAAALLLSRAGAGSDEDRNEILKYREKLGGSPSGFHRGIADGIML